MNISEIMEQLNRLGEQERIEAKAGSGVGKSILQTVCAFANAPSLNGGYLILGVKKNGLSKELLYSIVGVNDPEKLIEDIVSQCRSTFNIPISVKASQETIEGKVVVSIYVPEVNNGNKPVYFIKDQLPSGAYIRMGSSDVRCTEDDLLVFYHHRHIESFDYTIVPDAEMNDIDLEAVEDYKKERLNVHPNAEELRWSDQELLQSLCGLRKGNGEYKPTVAGILLFGTQKAARRLFPALRVDYMRVTGKEWVGDVDNRFMNVVEIRGSIMNVIRRTVSAIIDDLPKSFSLPDGSLQRQDTPIIPIKAIREAVVNAIMHRNYRVNQPIQVIRYANRLEIRNPGYSLVSEEHLGEPGSKSRNPKIAEVLHETLFSENKGSGIRAMRKSMQQAGLESPVFESDRGRDAFIATFLFHHFLNEESLAWLANFQEFRLTNEQARALVFVRELGAINNFIYREINQVDTLAASAALRVLRDFGLLETKGQGPATHYIPTIKLLEPKSCQTHQLNGETHQLGGETHQLGGETHQLGIKTHQHDNIEGGEVSSDQLPQELQKQLSELSRQSSESQVREVILAICAWSEITPNNLATLMAREKKHLVRKYLTPLIKESLLVYKYPQMPGHPKQAYKLKSGSL